MACQRGFAHSKRISVLVRADWVRRAPWEQSDRQARSSGRFAPRSCGGAPPEIQPAFPSLGAAAVPHAPKPKASCQPHPSRRFSCSQIRPPRLCPSRDSPKIHPPRGWNPRPPCCSRISPIRGASSLKPPKVLGGGPCLSYSMPRCLSYSLASIKPPLRGLAFPPWPRFPPCRRLPLLLGPASPLRRVPPLRGLAFPPLAALPPMPPPSPFARP